MGSHVAVQTDSIRSALPPSGFSSSCSSERDTSQESASVRLEAPWATTQHFAPTPQESRELTLMNSMRHWNVECPSKACCRWHVALKEAKRAIRGLKYLKEG